VHNDAIPTFVRAQATKVRDVHRLGASFSRDLIGMVNRVNLLWKFRSLSQDQKG